MNRPIREKDIERVFCEEIKRLGGIPIKLTSPQRRSVPDRMPLMQNGYHCFVEVKKVYAPLTSGQEREQKRLTDLGHDVFILRRKEDAKPLAQFIHDKALSTR